MFFLIPTARKLQGISSLLLLLRDQRSDARNQRSLLESGGYTLDLESRRVWMDAVKVVIPYHSVYRVGWAHVCRQLCYCRGQGECSHRTTCLGTCGNKRCSLRVWTGAMSAGPEGDADWPAEGWPVIGLVCSSARLFLLTYLLPLCPHSPHTIQHTHTYTPTLPLASAPSGTLQSPSPLAK